MGQQIIKQPNGKYAVFSSVVDGFVLLDATKQEVVEHFMESHRRDTERRVGEIVEQLESGGQPYHQFTKTFDEAAAMHIENHADDESAKWVAAISAGVEIPE